MQKISRQGRNRYYDTYVVEALRRDDHHRAARAAKGFKMTTEKQTPALSAADLETAADTAYNAYLAAARAALSAARARAAYPPAFTAPADYAAAVDAAIAAYRADRAAENAYTDYKVADRAVTADRVAARRAARAIAAALDID